MTTNELQVQVVAEQPPKPKKPRRPPKDPGECRPGDKGALHARLRDFGFRVPSEMRRAAPDKGKVQKAPSIGDKNNEPGRKPHNAAAAAKADVMTLNAAPQVQADNATPTPAPAPQPAPTPAPAAGGIDFEALAAKAVEAMLGAGVALANKAGEAVEAQGQAQQRLAAAAERQAAAAEAAIKADELTWGKVGRYAAKGGIVVVTGAALVAAGTVIHGAITGSGRFAPKPPVAG